MKVKTLNRSRASTERECVGDVRRQFRNLDPSAHPMPRAREYARAVTATKLDRMFAKPFLGHLGGGGGGGGSGRRCDGHTDGVTASACNRRSLVSFASGAADGAVKLWDLSTRNEVAEFAGGHNRIVTGVVFRLDGRALYSCGDDGFVRCWSAMPPTTTASYDDDPCDDARTTTTSTPTEKNKKTVGAGSINSRNGIKSTSPLLESWRTAGSFKSIDHHWMDNLFATASDEGVSIWSPERTGHPVQTHKSMWGSDDTITAVRYNPAETHLVALCSADRGVGLQDTRAGTPLRKTLLRMRANCVEWNPMEPMNFAVACEDYDAHVFDMRNLSRPTRILKGHAGAVMTLDFSPTGREVVTGSYDRTLRIFSLHQLPDGKGGGGGSNGGGFARDVYHAKRMQRIFTVHYTLDNRYIISGSDDTNLRLWKAQSSDAVGQRTRREEAALDYRQALVRRYRHMPEIRRIATSGRRKALPKSIRSQTQIARLQKEKEERKQENRIRHSKPGTYEHQSEKTKVVVKEIH